MGDFSWSELAIHMIARLFRNFFSFNLIIIIKWWKTWTGERWSYWNIAYKYILYQYKSSFRRNVWNVESLVHQDTLCFVLTFKSRDYHQSLKFYVMCVWTTVVCLLWVKRSVVPHYQRYYQRLRILKEEKTKSETSSIILNRKSTNLFVYCLG
jgi:hypothetical protein